MNKRLVIRLQSSILLIEAAAMLPSLLISIIYRDGATHAFLKTIGLILLFALIFRAVSFEFRNKVDSPVWCTFWDGVHFVSNLIPCILLGVAFANLFMGIPIDAQGVYHGNLLKLLNIYGLAGGVFFLVFFMMHGALWLTIKSEGPLQIRALTMVNILWPVLLGLLISSGLLNQIQKPSYGVHP